VFLFQVPSYSSYALVVLRRRAEGLQILVSWPLVASVEMTAKYLDTEGERKSSCTPQGALQPEKHEATLRQEIVGKR
jgi:hypothetical protein